MGTNVLRTSLSGSEQARFDVALGHALAPEAAVLLEAAELDHDNLMSFMKQTADEKFQIICATWYEPGTVPEGWTVQQLGE